MNAKQKFYCYSLTEVVLSNEEDGMARYVRDGVQNMESFATAQDAFDFFLKSEGYDHDRDSEIQYQTLTNDGQELVSLGFFRLLKEDGQRPTKLELCAWKNGELALSNHMYSIILYEFECKPLNLRAVKKNIKPV